MGLVSQFLWYDRIFKISQNIVNKCGRHKEAFMILVTYETVLQLCYGYVPVLQFELCLSIYPHSII